MNYNLDEEEKQFLQLLQTAKAEGSFDKNAYTSETKYSDCNIHYSITFFHRDVYCKIKFSSKCGTFSFSMDDSVCFSFENIIEKKYCTLKSYFFGFIKETPLDVNHPIIDACLTVHKELMQRIKEKETSKRQKNWDKLLSKS
jgi:hypothetical protein